MTSISRSILLAAGLLAFTTAGALAQQNSTSGEAGAGMKSASPTHQSGASGSSNERMANMNDEKSDKSTGAGSQDGSGKSTGPSAKQPK